MWRAIVTGTLALAALAISAPARADGTQPSEPASAPPAAATAPAAPAATAPAELLAPAEPSVSSKGPVEPSLGVPSVLSLDPSAAAEAVQSAPSVPPERRSRGVLAVGLSRGRFLGLGYDSFLIEPGVRVPRGPIRWVGDFGLEAGSSEHGLKMYRLGIAGGLENSGRFRIGAGLRGSYTIVLRATEADAFGKALFGNIGGFGIGGQAWLAADIVRSDRFNLGISLRGTAEIYKVGSALRLGPVIEATF